MNIQHESLVKKVEKAGLSPKEAKVYIALLELGGGAYPAALAKQTKLSRSSVYMVLMHLSVKDLVNEIKKKNKQFYQINNPKKLISLSKGKLTTVEDEIDAAKNVLPELEGLFNALEYKPKVTYYEGVEGITFVYSTHVTVESPYTMYAWANTGELEDLLSQKFLLWYRKEKERNRIKGKIILPNNIATKNFSKTIYKNIKKEYVPEMKYISTEAFPYKAEITVYDKNKVSIVTLVKGKLIGVIIEDETVSGLMRMIFNIGWENVRD